MKKLTRRRTVITCLILTGAVIGALSIPSLVDYFRFRSVLVDEIHPVSKEFDSGRIRDGADLSTLMESHPPSEHFEIGPYSEISYLKEYESSEPALYFPGLYVTAKNGILVRASADSCTWSKVFFDSLSQEDEVEMQKLHSDSAPMRRTEWPSTSAP